MEAGLQKDYGRKFSCHGSLGSVSGDLIKRCSRIRGRHDRFCMLYDGDAEIAGGVVNTGNSACPVCLYLYQVDEVWGKRSLYGLITFIGGHHACSS